MEDRNVACVTVLALSIHDLTDEIPIHSNIAIPRGANSLAVWTSPISWHHFDAATFDSGRTEYVLPGGRTIGLYSGERTIFDLFRLTVEAGTLLRSLATVVAYRGVTLIPVLPALAQMPERAQPKWRASATRF